MRSYDAILEALNNHGKKVRRAGRKAMAQCPAHDDGRPSLSVTHDGDKTLIYCHAACPPGAIMAALDLPLSELWDDQREATFDNLIGYKLLIDAMPKLTVIDGTWPKGDTQCGATTSNTTTTAEAPTGSSSNASSTPAPSTSFPLIT